MADARQWINVVNLCERFHWLPSELMQEDGKVINRFLEVLGILDEIREAERKRAEKSAG